MSERPDLYVEMRNGFTRARAPGDILAYIADLEARLRECEEALRQVQEIQPRTVDGFCKHSIVFDEAPGSDAPEAHSQRFAFRIYTDLCETETIARAALQRARDDG